MKAQENRIFEFGPFRLHLREGTLLKDDRPVSLTPKVFEMLALLVENSGRLVLKEEMMSRLWPDSFVEDVNVNRNISTLRRLLDDSTVEPVYIETVPKRGYRFIANVVELDSTQADFMLERRTSAEIIVEHEEETSDSSGSDFSLKEDHPTSVLSKTKFTDSLRRPSLQVAAVAAVLAVFLGIYSVRDGKPAGAADSPKLNSIAVLPFRDLAANDNDHLGAGMADVLITRLSRLKDLKVRPTAAVLKYETDQDLTAVAQTLGVDALLQGTIQRVNDRIRVTARLLRTSDQSSIWSGQFDERAQDIFALEDAISSQLVESLAPSLDAREKNAIGKRLTQDPDAYQFYIKGRYYWSLRTELGNVRAQYFFRHAIEKDPAFAPAYSGLADALFMSSPSAEAYRALTKCLELDSSLGEAHATQGFEKMFYHWDWDGAEDSFKRSIELNPRYGTAYQWYATLLAITGRLDEAKQMIRRALEIDPSSPNFLTDLAQMHYFAREYSQAETLCRKALEISPDFICAHQDLADIYFKTGRDEEALEEFIRMQVVDSLAPGDSKGKQEYDAALMSRSFKSGKTGFFREEIDQLLHRSHAMASFTVAKDYARLGDKQQALRWLEEAYDNRIFLMAFVGVDPLFDDVRGEARYQSILHRMGLELK